MRIVIIVCLLFFGLNSQAQAYKPMLAQFNEWHLTNCFSGCGTDIYYTDADTVVNGLTYAILDGFHYISRTFLLREDVGEKKVYMLLMGVGKTDVEYLLYDFSLQPGDSMLIYNPISPLPDSAGYFRVDSIINEVLIDGDTYRHFYLSASDSNQSIEPTAEWIEGIGSLALINTPGAAPKINAHGALSCFFNNLTLHYSNLDSIDACVQVHTDLGLSNFESNLQLSVFPNPTGNELHISVPAENVKWVEIYDMLGHQVLRKLTIGNQNEFQCSVSMFQPGIYLIKVLTESQKQFTSRLVIK